LQALRYRAASSNRGLSSQRAPPLPRTSRPAHPKTPGLSTVSSQPAQLSDSLDPYPRPAQCNPLHLAHPTHFATFPPFPYSSRTARPCWPSLCHRFETFIPLTLSCFPTSNSHGSRLIFRPSSRSTRHDTTRSLALVRLWTWVTTVTDGLNHRAPPITPVLTYVLTRGQQRSLHAALATTWGLNGL
jgi:hypothetical protein